MESNSSELVQIKPVSKKSAAANKRKLFIKTFGCQMNVYDSDKLERILEEDFERIDSPEKADLILINTCSVREKPEQKLFSLLGEFGKLKAKNSDLLIGVGGCVAQQEGQSIIKRSSVPVDFVFGTHNLSLVPSLIELRRNGSDPQVAVDYRDEWEDLPLGLVDRGRVSAFISISRGCNKNCTYCIVPKTRGREVSRAFAEIEKEAKIAVHRGVREIILLGQTVNSYGLDLNPKIKFVELLESLSQIAGLLRIRFTSPHPQEVRSDFSDLLKNNAKICRHIHMPLQSGSNRILKLMNRNYKREKYLKIIEDLKAKAPDVAITTDIIVGFPGETEADFRDTLEVMDLVQFDNSYSFIFSPRPGTKAATMEDQLTRELKLERLYILQKRQEEITTARLKSWVGSTVEVLLDGPSALHKECLQGRSSQNIVVNLDQSYPGLEPGMLVNVKIKAAADFTLKGELA